MKLILTIVIFIINNINNNCNHIVSLVIIIIIMIIIIIISWAFRLAPALCRRKDASTAPAALSGLGDPFSGSRLGIEDAWLNSWRRGAAALLPRQTDCNQWTSKRISSSWSTIRSFVDPILFFSHQYHIALRCGDCLGLLHISDLIQRIVKPKELRSHWGPNVCWLNV